VDSNQTKIWSRFQCGAREELWDRWRRGESLKAIGRAFGKPSSSIHFLAAPHGSIRPRRRRRSRLALTFAKREEISRKIAAARSLRAMARLVGHAPSKVSREIRRNGGYDRYRAALADENAWARVRRPKQSKLARSPRLLPVWRLPITLRVGSGSTPIRTARRVNCCDLAPASPTV
jgi:hypothetical protein